MKRRDFIKMGSFITVSVAALGVTACGSSSDDNSTTTTTNPNRPIPPAATGANWLFPQSVASGDPKSDSLMFWTRVTPSSIPATDFATVTSVSTAVLLRVTTTDNSASLGTNAALTGTLVAEVTVPAYSDFDGTIRHKLTGLTPDTVYYYQFVAGTVTSNVGRTKTAPAASSTADVKFAFMSCQDWNANHWGAFTQIVADDGSGATPSLDFIVHLGDYIYENAADTSPTPAPVEASHTSHTLSAANATTTNDYRYLYKRYRSDPRLQRMHERFPMVAIWDDHEFSDDCWQDHETYSNDNLEQLSRRRSANQGWFEFTAADITYSETDTGFQNIKIYRDLKFGQTMHLIMTDERLYRADHMIPENSPKPNTTGVGVANQLGRINSRYLAPEATYKFIESVKYGLLDDPLATMTMLGTTQRAWWKSTMAGSTATWKVWGNEVSLLRMGLHGTNALSELISLSIYSAVTGSSGIPAATTAISGTYYAAINAAVVALVSKGVAQSTATTLVTTMATSYSTDGDRVTFLMSQGLSSGDAQAIVGVFNYANAINKNIIASAIVAAVTANADQTTQAGPAAFAITATDANPAANTAARVAAAKLAGGLSDTQADTAVAAYEAAKAVAGSGNATIIQTAGQTIAFAKARVDMKANKASSPFFLKATGASASAVAAFFQKFILNADQWDGYQKERKELMNHLITNGIQNVVAVTGDIHAFFAGQVYNDFAGEVSTFNMVSGSAVEATAATADTAAMVDLVTAGISSTSWFNYIKAAVDVLDPPDMTTGKPKLIGNLVYAPIDVALPAGALYTSPVNSPALNFRVSLNLLDYSMGKAAPANTTQLAAQLNDQLKRKLAEGGVFEAALDASAAGVQAVIAGKPEFASALVLAQTLATAVAANPWLKYVDTDAQGYAVVTASSGTLSCVFKKLNPLVATAAPGASRIVASSKTLTITAGSTAIS